MNRFARYIRCLTTCPFKKDIQLRQWSTALFAATHSEVDQTEQAENWFRIVRLQCALWTCSGQSEYTIAVEKKQEVTKMNLQNTLDLVQNERKRGKKNDKTCLLNVWWIIHANCHPKREKDRRKGARKVFLLFAWPSELGKGVSCFKDFHLKSFRHRWRDPRKRQPAHKINQSPQQDVKAGLDFNWTGG